MKGLSILSPAAIPYAAFIGAAGPVAAMKYEFYRTDLTSHLLGWGFDTMGQYQAMSAGAVAIASAILFSVAMSTPARRLPASITEYNKGSAPVELVTSGVIS
jgi:hypothetical protein